MAIQFLNSWLGRLLTFMSCLAIFACAPPSFNSFADRNSLEFGVVNNLLLSGSASAAGTPGLSTSLSSLSMREGAAGSYDLTLSAAPANVVEVDISFDASQVMVAGSSVSPARVSLDSAAALQISVVPVDDSTTSGTRSTTISHVVVGGVTNNPDDVTLTIQDNELRIYATAGTWTGLGVGGITGADLKCNGSDVNKPAGAVTWKALLTDGTNRVACTTAFCVGGESENTDWVMYSNVEYRRGDGTTVIAVTQAGGIWTFNASAGVTAALITPWTGFLNDWRSEASPCANWMGTGGNANIGNSQVNTNLMINAGGTACSGARALYCAEQ